MTRVPAALRDIADAIGAGATARLAAARPGERVHIPKAIAPGHWIARAIGAEAAARLAAACGGCAFDLPPSADSGAKAARRACDAALAAGASLNEAVRASGLSRSAVQWRRKHKVRPPAAKGTGP